MDNLGRRLVGVLGEPAAIELLAVLELPQDDRARMVGGLYQSEHGQALAELLADIETDPDDLTRLRLIGALRQVLG